MADAPDTADLGDMEGEHAGEKYKIVALRGHLLELEKENKWFRTTATTCLSPPT